MAKDSTPWKSGSDAAYMKPRFVPNDKLQPRDDSGGPEDSPYTAAFGDGGFVTGEKSHLTTGMIDDNEMDLDMQTSQPRAKGAMKGGMLPKVATKSPGKSVSEQKE